jgi:septum formation protein
MKHVVLPDGKEQGEVCFALTADTLGLTKDGQKMGKPTSRQEAIQMLRNSRGGNICATGFCIRKLQWDGKVWNVLREVIDVVQTSYIMDVPEEFLDHYLDTIPYKQVSGAIGIELAPQYCKQVNGSYTAVVGLPVYEVRETLHQLGFYE